MPSCWSRHRATRESGSGCARGAPCGYRPAVSGRNRRDLPDRRAAGVARALLSGPCFGVRKRVDMVFTPGRSRLAFLCSTLVGDAVRLMPARKGSANRRGLDRMRRSDEKLELPPGVCALALAGCSTGPARRRSRNRRCGAWSAERKARSANREGGGRTFQDRQLDTLVDGRSDQPTCRLGDPGHRAQLQAALVDTTERRRSRSTRFRPSPAASTRVTARSSGLTSLLSFEVDLWGKLANQRKASRWEAQPPRPTAGLRATLPDDAKLYWQIAYLNQLVRWPTRIEYARARWSWRAPSTRSGRARN